MSTIFIIPTLLAAGFGRAGGDQAKFTGMTSATWQPGGNTLFERFKQQHLLTLASHASHSSHSSHSSHQSGYSGGGHYSHTSHQSSAAGYGGYGGYPSTPAPTPAPQRFYTAPAPVPAPANTPEPVTGNYQPSEGASSTPATSDNLPALSGRTQKFVVIVRRVQIALLAQGLFEGSINGVVGPGTRSALRAFQESHGLQPTGTITPETLDALRVPSN